MKSLPDKGAGWAELEARMREAGTHDVDWRHGRSPALIHYAGEDVLQVARQAYQMYFSENGLGLRVFHSLRTFETEVVEMALGLFHGQQGARGAMTTGGTESIFLAVKAAREAALARRSFAGTPTIVLPRSAHPAFDKAAHFMGLKAVRTPLGPDLRADPQAMASAVTPDTFMLVGSAPAYSYGLIDPITDIAALALERGLWMHTDACVGGYLAPFAAQLGAAVEPFDFSVPGVTSLSADLHKYGYAAKGASSVFFADEAAFSHLGYEFHDWPNGRYMTHTLVGTRPGGAIASAWAVMNYLGREGYLRVTRRVLDTRKALQAGVESLGFAALGHPQLSILAFGSPRHDFARIGSSLLEKGWVSNFVKNPDGIHVMLNLTHEPVIPAYLADLGEAAKDAEGASHPDLKAVY